MNRNVNNVNLATRNSFFDLDHIFDAGWSPFYSASVKSKEETFSPRVDIENTAKAYVLSAELPGVSKEDIKVTLTEGILTLEAESKQVKREEDAGRVVRQERRYGKYMRRFQLDDNVQDSDVVASFKDGVLKLEVPKVEPKKPETRQIKIVEH